MKKVTIIVLSSIVGLFIVLMTSLYFYASAKITPEMVHKIALEQLQKTFPKAKIKLGKIDLSFGFNITFELDELDMKQGKHKLASVRNLSANIPIWSIITGGGTIQIEVNKPEVGFYQFKKGNNWTVAMGGSAPAKVASGKKDSDSMEITVPAIVSRFRLNVKVIEVAVNYGLADGSKGQLKLERFLIKNLNFDTPTAFELLSRVEAQMGKDQSISLEGLVLGELNLGELIAKQQITCKTMVKIRNVKFSSFPADVPEIVTNVVVKIDKKGNISGNSVTSFSQRNKVGASFSVTSEKISVSKINSEIYIADLLKIADFKNKMLDAKKAKLTLGGKVDLVGTKIMPSLEFGLKPGIGFKYQAASGVSTAKGSFMGTKLFIGSYTSVLGGRVNMTVKHNSINLSDKNFDPFKLKPFVVNMEVSHMKATRSQLQDIIYGGMKAAPVKKGAGVTETKEIAKAEPLPPILLPAATVGMKCANNDFGGTEFTCNGKIRISNKSIRTEYLNFSLSKGRGKVSHTSNFTHKGIMSKFDFGLTRLDLLGLSPFLPSMVKSISGTANGKVKGVVNYMNNGALSYDVSVDTDVSKGEIKGMDLAGKLNKVTKALGKVIPKLKSVKKLQVGDNFETLVLKGRFSDTKYEFSKIDFVGLHKKLRLNTIRGGKAYMFPPPYKKKGVMDLNFVEDYGLVCGAVKDATGSKVIPLRLSGEEFVLTPEIGYTVEKIGTAAAKYQAKKAVKKATKKTKKKMKKKLKKLLKF